MSHKLRRFLDSFLCFRPKNCSPRINLSVPERGCKVPLAIGENIGNAKFDNNLPHRSAVECLSPRLSQRRFVYLFLKKKTKEFFPEKLQMFFPIKDENRIENGQDRNRRDFF